MQNARMKMIIVGAGRVGESAAESLLSERNDITVIDTDAGRLARLQEQFDLRGVLGSGIEPEVLREAGAPDADMLIACAPLDETNLLACKFARDLFNVQTTVARVRSTAFHDEALLEKTGFAVDQVICPERSVTNYIHKLVEYPEALQVIQFAQGLVSLIAVRAVEGSPLVGHSLADIPSLVPDADMRIVAIYRNDRAVGMLHGETRIRADDEVFVLAATQHIRGVLGGLRQMDRPVERIMMAGGGRVGMRLARELHGSCAIKLIERDLDRCELLAENLPDDVLVLNGDATDADLMANEQVADMDLFMALTSDDEDNIMACLLAKRLGVRRVLALINRRAYADLVQGTQIDIAISPAHTIIGELLAFVRRGDIEVVHSLRRGAAEALELVVRGDRKTSKVATRRIDEIRLPDGAQIGAIVRGPEDGPREVIIPHRDTVIASDDHVIVFVPHKGMIRDIERLFQVSATFLF